VTDNLVTQLNGPEIEDVGRGTRSVKVFRPRYNLADRYKRGPIDVREARMIYERQGCVKHDEIEDDRSG